MVSRRKARRTKNENALSQTTLDYYGVTPVHIVYIHYRQRLNIGMTRNSKDDDFWVAYVFRAPLRTINLVPRRHRHCEKPKPDTSEFEHGSKLLISKSESDTLRVVQLSWRSHIMKGNTAYE